jgi:hypothetical protein
MEGVDHAPSSVREYNRIKTAHRPKGPTRQGLSQPLSQVAPGDARPAACQTGQLSRMQYELELIAELMLELRGVERGGELARDQSLESRG